MRLHVGTATLLVIISSRSLAVAQGEPQSESPYITSLIVPAVPSDAATDAGVNVKATASTTSVHCGCDSCTSQVWESIAIDAGGNYSCGARINWVQKTEGMSELDSCERVSNEYSQGPCGPACHPLLCNLTLLEEPVSAVPSDAATDAGVNVKATASTTSVHCGCDSCTSQVWESIAIDAGGNYSCGARINWVQKTEGMSELDSCERVSNEYSQGPCGPACHPLLCNLTLLEEPDSSKLIWSDEFDVDGAPDSNKWDYDLGDGCESGICGWGNGELQWYTNSNAVVANGILRITAKKEARGGKEYTSTRMVTSGLHSFRYGRIRFRAKVAGCTAKGTWPALWLLPELWVNGDWPKSGEIDVMEAVGYEENRFYGSVHTESFNHGIGTQKTGTIIKPETDWHIFEIDWGADKIRFVIDKEVYFVFAPEDINNPALWPFNEDFHLLMNIAVGGNWGGLQGVDAAAFEGDGQYMEIDWVRVYSM